MQLALEYGCLWILMPVIILRTLKSMTIMEATLTRFSLHETAECVHCVASFEDMAGLVGPNDRVRYGQLSVVSLLADHGGGVRLHFRLLYIVVQLAAGCNRRGRYGMAEMPILTMFKFPGRNPSHRQPRAFSSPEHPALL